MLTLRDIIVATQGDHLIGPKTAASFMKTDKAVSFDRRVKGVSTDSRTLKKGELYVAIVGPKFDGHKFIPDAISRGAAAVVFSSGQVVLDTPVPMVRVPDTTRALGDLARYHRRRFNVPVIAITGSAGKTTTKDLIAKVLSSKYSVLKNPRTENNQYGVPLALLKLRPKHQCVVLELGTNQPGDIDAVARVVEPTIAVFTNIGDSHLERLKSKNGVFHEKMNMLRYLSENGTVVLNFDDTYLRMMRRYNFPQNFVTYSVKNPSDYQVINLNVKNGRTYFELKKNKWDLKTPAAHNVYNATVAVVCGIELGVSYSSIKKVLSQFRFSGGRQELKRLGQYWLIDDTYNANPISFKSAIQTLAALDAKGRKIFICSDMLELGDKTIDLHQSMGKALASSNVDCVLTTGKLAKHISSHLKRYRKSIVTHHCETQKQLHNRLKSFCRPGDALLVKGSRGMEMEKTIEFLKENLN